MKAFRLIFSVITVVLLSLIVSLYSSAAEICVHDFAPLNNRSNVISYSDGTHSFSCLNGCGASGTSAQGVGGKEICSFDVVSETESTCTEKGKRYYMCEICFYHKDEVLPLKEHDFKTESELPLCDKETNILYTCKECEYSYSEPVDATGHISDGGVISESLSDNNTVTLVFTCRTCGETIERKTIKRVLYNESKYKYSADNSESTLNENNSIITYAEPDKIRGVKIIKKRKTRLTLTWKDTECDGYQIKLSPKKAFKSKDTKVIYSDKNKVTIKNIRHNKCYIKIRAYKVVNGKKLFGPYSKVKKVNLKLK